MNDPAIYNLDVWPISLHRAKSHALNPRADSEDVALIVAFDEMENICGYIGILPDIAFVNDQNFKVGWLSCWWVDPKMRGTGTGKKLLNRAIDLYDKRVMLTEFTTEAGNIYKKHPSLEMLLPLRGKKIFFKSISRKILPRKKQFWKWMFPFLFIGDALHNLIRQPSSKLKRFNQGKNNHVEEIKSIGAEIESFITPFLQKNLFKRDYHSFNWIVNNPWILKEPFDQEQKNKYAFTSSKKHAWLKQYVSKNSDGEIDAYFILLNNDRQLKIPYLFSTGRSIGSVSRFIWNLIEVEKIESLTFYHNYLSDYLNVNKFPSLHTRDTQRNYISGLNLAAFFSEETVIFDGDGDCAFT